MGTTLSRLGKPLATRLVIGGAMLGAVSFAPSAIAGDPYLPVVVTSRADKTMKVRVYSGDARPCDSSSNMKVVDASISSGERLTSSSPAFCFCVQQTTSAWPETEWTMPQTVCRPRTCTGWGRYRRCTIAGDPTLNISVYNTREER
jgi:hypothetical protein